MDLRPLLQAMVRHGGSDLYLTTGAPPSIRIHGSLRALGNEILQPGMVHEVAYGVMSNVQIRDFEIKPEMNLGISESGIGRFRVNIFRQRHEISMVIRAITDEIPPFDSLGLPPTIKQLVMRKRGLILFVGGTGAGKSTSLAALIDHRNSHSAGHIITIEDPVEYVHRHKKSIVNQREVGVDTDSYEDALENTLRQAPDVILIGEVRTRETMEHAITFAETGHLCLTTLHANNANQALERVINFFPEQRHKQLLLDLSLNLVAVISQRLIPSIEGNRAAAVEVLLGTPRARDLIRKGEVSTLKELMEKSADQGMQTFDASLLALYSTGVITQEEALRNADSANNLRLKIRLRESLKEELEAAQEEARDDGDSDALELQPIGDERP